MSMIKEGSIVVVKDWTDQEKEVKVDSIGTKKGFIVFDYDTKPDGTSRWAYADQILKVVKY
tara:strand:- start:376 stop:558 length:183 start_codon:yes stop_codon:yes gene_type:complete